MTHTKKMILALLSALVGGLTVAEPTKPNILFIFADEYGDIVADPCERNDLASAKPEAVAQLTEKLTRWKATLSPKPDSACFSETRSSL